MEPLDPKAELMRLADQFAHAWQMDYSLEKCGDARTALSDAIILALADARRLALEEAAQVCEEKSMGLYGNSSAMGYRIGAEHCEIGIRALIDQKVGGK